MAETDCLFCRIVAREVPADIVAESEVAVAFRDLTPQAPTHVLVVPRRHHATLGEVAGSGDDRDVAGMIRLASEVATIDGVAETGYRMVANTGADAHQTVLHAHLHVLGGRPMQWPPG